MIELLSLLFPSYHIYRISPFEKEISISLSSHSYMFFIEYLSKDDSKALLIEMQNSLYNLFPQEIIECNLVYTKDILPIEYLYIKLQKNSEKHFLALPIEFINFLSMICKKSPFQHPTLLSLYKDLSLFRPYLLSPHQFIKLPDLELRHLFHHLLTQGIFTTKMLALFLNFVPIKNTQRYFSDRIYQEIIEEQDNLSESDHQLTPIIYFIVELNLFNHLKNKDIDQIKIKKISLLDHLSYFLENSLPNMEITDFKTFKELQKHCSYQNILSFLRYSHPKNLDIYNSQLSYDGQKKLAEDLTQKNHILRTMPVLEKLAFIKSQSSFIDVEQIVQYHIKDPAMWFYILQYTDLRDIIIILQSLKKEPPLPSILQKLLKSINEDQLLIKGVDKRNKLHAEKNFMKSFVLLQFLNLIP